LALAEATLVLLLPPLMLPLAFAAAAAAAAAAAVLLAPPMCTPQVQAPAASSGHHNHIETPAPSHRLSQSTPAPELLVCVLQQLCNIRSVCCATVNLQVGVLQLLLQLLLPRLLLLLLLLRMWGGRICSIWRCHARRLHTAAAAWPAAVADAATPHVAWCAAAAGAGPIILGAG
jgi:hypothetical protein